MASKKWMDFYVEFGDTRAIVSDGVDRAQRMTCHTILGNDSLKPSQKMSLVQGLWKCSLMCWTIIMSIKVSPCRVSLQLDESTDVGNMSQRIIFVRFVKAGLFADEFLCCLSLSLRTRAVDIFKLIDAFFQHHSISWDKVGSLCTDGAPAMMGHRSGFTVLVKQRAPHVNTSQCILHCHALATRTLPIVFKVVLDTTVRIL